MSVENYFSIVDQFDNANNYKNYPSYGYIKKKGILFDNIFLDTSKGE